MLDILQIWAPCGTAFALVIGACLTFFFLRGPVCA
jgi:hypothetical protein